MPKKEYDDIVFLLRVCDICLRKFYKIWNFTMFSNKQVQESTYTQGPISFEYGTVL